MANNKSYTIVVDANEVTNNQVKNKKYKNNKKHHNKNENKTIINRANLRKIDYMINVNGRCVKSGTDRVDFKKLQEFERELIQMYTKRPTDNVEVLFR
jgi:hypothetical protein